MIINLTPHTISIYSEECFKGLEQSKPTVFLADAVEGEPILFLESSGVARITVSITEAGEKEGITFVKSEYGELIGIPPEITEEDILIVSLPTKSNALTSGHPLASQMVSPYKVVRQRSNSSNILGCIGLSY